MLELQNWRPMPHATTSDAPVNRLPPWPTLRDAPATSSTSSLLPLPFSNQPLAQLKPVFTANNGLITPPSDMNGVASSSGGNPQHHPPASTVSNGEMTFDLRPKMAVTAYQPPNYSAASASSTAVRSNFSAASSTNTFRSNFSRASGSTDAGSPLPKSSVSSFTALDIRSERRLSTPDEEAIAPSLRLPRTVQAPQSGLPQLAAEVEMVRLPGESDISLTACKVTCLFWFETGATLRQIESAPDHLPAFPSLSTPPEVKPQIQFRKWVVTLLSTTQVTQSVILLALMFIYRLKGYNPTVKGKPGSEYRLLTVALMLGNKFLDDNTYTNKTWAEVSGISVQEVHTMEVEFLSNMRYSLYTSEKTWLEWHKKLGKFGAFADRAIQMLDAPPRMPVIHPGLPSVPAALPSPPASTNASPPFQGSYSPAHLARGNTLLPGVGSSTNTPLLLPQIGSSVISPIGPLPEVELRPSARKRSYDEDLVEPPAKRLTHSYTIQLPYPVGTGSELPLSHAVAQQRVSLPSLSIPTTTTAPAPQITQQLPIPGSRAMSLVYPQAQWNTAPSSMPVSIPPLQTTTLPPVTTAQLDVSRQLSPYPIGSATSSPLSATFPPPSSNTPSHSRLSPSYYLAQRSSPYRPVRRVQTLLVPPSTAFHHPARPIAQDQMQYHPLGRPMNERRVGHLPYIHHDAWPQTQQLNQWHELHHQPPPRQPVFQ